ncbi:MAG: cysteine hydrolase [Candidatus Rokuibacteriota bacterium]|nr:MAG: cysteine hydrolase [Candidatus Rokubacteria bacterium]PYM66138.1 MAG: cysteine hydrolase [Candidatus Rokubacteria bacterium]
MTVDVFSAKRLERQVRIDPKATGIVVIDMLNEFCKAGGAMVLPGYERLIPPQKKVIDAGRHAGSPVLFVVDTHRRNVRQDREFLKRTSHCLEGSWGAQVIEDLDPRPDDLYIVKRRYSAFFNTDLDLTLRDLQVNTLVIFGVVTNICVRSTVHDAFFLGYQVVVPEDCVAATGPREQESSLYDIGTHFGIVADSEQVTGALLRSAPLENRIAA